MAMSLVKVPFIALDAFNMLINATPPNPPVLKGEFIVPDWRERFLKSLGKPCRLLRTMYWTICFVEVLAIITTQCSEHIVASKILGILTNNPASTRHIRITPQFVVGNVLGIFGTVLRISSFRSLGRYFTFELCIRPDHRLVVNGPYSVIRHPSYTGLIMTVIGHYCLHASGSWLTECGLLHTVAGKLMLCIWSTIAIAVIASLLLRMSPEDQLLHDKFGGEWEEWVKRVPYKLIPGIY